MAPVHLTRQHMCVWACFINAHLCINAREHINGSKHALAGSTRFLLRLFAKIRVWRIFIEFFLSSTRCSLRREVSWLIRHGFITQRG